MASVYFDTSIFLAIFNKEASGPQIKSLLRELRRDKVKIYTSVITIQEVSVLSFRKGVPADENHAKVSKLARIQGNHKGHRAYGRQIRGATERCPREVGRFLGRTYRG